MGDHGKGIILVMLIFLFSWCNGSRDTQTLRLTPAVSNSEGWFFGFLPRSMPIPPSGPSRHHNAIDMHSRPTNP
ncbi:unnamed protein product [Spirodela intermedia]|uniref:Uncharacterized protein n=1 Tax=Spirodela intermedia TaxID=51605 RepID=A0A7I8J0U9_SPIIN|nr:unnamed protein product [Spirodela intermedia]CAA6663768.1 unnamed protein product [Spirodela intermedia]